MIRLAALILVVSATAASAQTNRMKQSQSDVSCTVAKCIKNQATKGYSAAQASNWCPKNLHRGCVKS